MVVVHTFPTLSQGSVILPESLLALLCVPAAHRATASKGTAGLQHLCALLVIS